MNQEIQASIEAVTKGIDACLSSPECTDERQAETSTDDKK